MAKPFWCLCHECGYEWIAHFASDHGLLFAVDDLGEECPECGHSDVEATDEFRCPGPFEGREE